MAIYDDYGGSDNQVTITIFDKDGKIVSSSTFEAQTATKEEIDEMVSLIEHGTPAHIAAMLVKPASAEDA